MPSGYVGKKQNAIPWRKGEGGRPGSSLKKGKENRRFPSAKKRRFCGKATEEGEVSKESWGGKGPSS